MNATFASTSLDPSLLPMWRQDWFLELVKWAVIGVIALVFLLLVVRPLMKRLLAPPPAPTAGLPGPVAEATGGSGPDGGADAEGGEGALAELAEDRLQLSDAATGTPRLGHDAAAALDEKIRQARLLVAEDPRRAVQVLRAWMDTPALAAPPEATEADAES